MTVQPTRDQLRALAARAVDDGYTGNDDYGHLTVSPAVLTAILDALDQAEARIQAVRNVHRHITVETRGAIEPEHRCLDCCLAWPCPTIRALEG